jgi:hypothetical protein
MMEMKLGGVKKMFGMSCFCLFMMAVSYIYSAWQNYQIGKDSILDRYNTTEMLIYWLYADSITEKITVSYRKKELCLYMEDNKKITLPIENMQIEGNGKEVQIVDLDKMVLKTA